MQISRLISFFETTVVVSRFTTQDFGMQSSLSSLTSTGIPRILVVTLAADSQSLWSIFFQSLKKNCTVFAKLTILTLSELSTWSYWELPGVTWSIKEWIY